MNKHTSLSALLRTSTLALALGASALAGCGNDELVEARATISKVGQALFLSGDVQLLKGKYYNCRTHTDGSTWSIANGVAAQGDQVQVVKRNSACQLTIDGIVIERDEVQVTFNAASPFVLGEAYQSEAMLFSSGSEKFYSNLKLSDDSYADAFDILMMFSSDPGDVDEGATATYAKSTTDQISVDGVPTPDYDFENNGLTIPVRDDFSLDADATGGIKLNRGTVQGDKYILTQMDPGSTVNELNSFWVTNAGAAVSITPDTDISLAGAADLDLIEDASVATPVVWYVLIANWDAADPGTRSYQKFTITITHP